MSVEVPLSIKELKSSAPEEAARIQSGLRERMTDLFGQNFFASRLTIDVASQKATYLFESFEKTNPFS